MLKEHHSRFWDDAIFIIYFTYYTSFCYNSLNDEDFNYDTLYLVDKYNKGMATSYFKEAFDFIARYDFKRKSSKDETVKRQLIEKNKSFNKKFKNRELVEAFLVHADKTIENGL